MLKLSNLFKSYEKAKLSFSDIYINEKEKNDEGFVYARFGHPNVFRLEKRLIELNEVENLLVTNCGMSAIDTAISSLITDSDTKVIIVIGDIYSGTMSYFENIVFKMRGVRVVFLDKITDLENQICEFQNSIVYFESCSNPFLEVLDIERIVRIARKNGCRICVDNTILTCLNLNLIELGIDIAVSSLTKFYSGYNNVMGGEILCLDENMFWKCVKYRNRIGLTIDPNAALMLHDNTKNFEARYVKQSKQALILVHYLNECKYVKTIWHTSQSNDLSKVANKRIIHPPVITFSLVDNIDVDEFLCSISKSIHYGAALGYLESNIVSLEDMRMGLKGSSIRISVGFDDVYNVITAFENALKKYGLRELY